MISLFFVRLNFPKAENAEDAEIAEDIICKIISKFI